MGQSGSTDQYLQQMALYTWLVLRKKQMDYYKHFAGYA